MKIKDAITSYWYQITVGFILIKALQNLVPSA